jgi:predicted phage-related endonuclease
MLSPEQKELRKGHIGASEVPALFGEHIKLTGTDLWLKHAFESEDVEIKSDAIDIGDTFEAPLIAWAAKELGVEVSTNPKDLFSVCAEHPVLAATLDARILPKSKREAIEAKTTSVNDMEFGGKDNEWGEKNTDQIPSRVILQCQSQMLCHDLERVHVVALLGRMGIRRELFKIERNDEIIAMIIERAESFWQNYVIPKIQPPEDQFGLGGIDIIKRVVRVPQTWATVPDELINDWDAKRQARLEAEKEEKEALSRVLTPLGDAEGVQMGDGRVLEYYPTARKSLDQNRLKAEAPDVYAAFQKESISRNPRIKQGRA